MAAPASPNRRPPSIETELADLPDDQIHDPDDKRRPDDYPAKIIGHREARERALSAYREAKGE